MNCVTHKYNSGNLDVVVYAWYLIAREVVEIEIASEQPNLRKQVVFQRMIPQVILWPPDMDIRIHTCTGQKGGLFPFLPLLQVTE